MERDGQHVDVRSSQGAQVGDGNIQINMFSGTGRAQLRPNAYLEQVRRIAPPELTARDSELAELARFCLAPDAAGSGTRYAWWQAGPWAGKSALMSTFVLRPPAEVSEQVRIVSFFITARLAAQDTREAFLEVVLEQLASLLGQELPPVLPEATRDAYFLNLMREAATSCKEAGGRLILLVDGLDEDRGVAAGPVTHSIAALLPADLPAGMRVIVASRPAPGIPDDVPDSHPLRDPAIIRPLEPSPHASDIKRRSREELRRLLHGSTAGQDILGMLAAARGGLTAHDLAELTHVPLWEIEDILRTTAGRIFSSRPSPSGRGDRHDIYLLGHEELQVQAEDYFGTRLDDARDRLHAWAVQYRNRNWPEDTPEYLLSGYFRLLVDLGDLPRMTECASDATRQDRMLNLTGGDVAAIVEARAVLGRIAAQDAPNLGDALAVAYRRDELSDRNWGIPEYLPAAWAALGQFSRAIALAGSAAEIPGYPVAVTELAAVLASAGHLQDAVAAACSIINPVQRVGALAKTVEALTRADLVPQSAAIANLAERTARSISDADDKAAALSLAAGALASAGSYGAAEAAANVINRPYEQCCALALIGASLATGGKHQQATAIAHRAEATARSIDDANRRPDALSRIAEVFARSGQYQHAQVIAGQVEASYSAMTESAFQATTAAHVAGTRVRTDGLETASTSGLAFLDNAESNGIRVEIVAPIAEASHYDLASALARALPDPAAQIRGLLDVASQLAMDGLQEQAATLALEAEETAHSISLQEWRANFMARIAVVFAAAGQSGRASAIATQAEVEARAAPQQFQIYALTRKIAVLGQAGKPELAKILAARAEAAARSLPHEVQTASHLAKIATALASAGLYERARSLTERVLVPFSRMDALAGITDALADAGEHEQAIATARQAEEAALNISDKYEREHALHLAARALARTGQAQQAEYLVQAMSDRSQQEEILALVADAYASAGSRDQAETIARTITDPSRQAYALALVAERLAKAGLHHVSTAIASDSAATAISHPALERATLVRVARALAISGQFQAALVIAVKSNLPENRAECLIAVAKELAQAGHREWALTVIQAALATVGSINLDVMRVSPVAKSVEVLAITGDTSDASRLAAQVCSAQGWTMVVGSILKIAPDALDTLARVIHKDSTMIKSRTNSELTAPP